MWNNCTTYNYNLALLNFTKFECKLEDFDYSNERENNTMSDTLSFTITDIVDSKAKEIICPCKTQPYTHCTITRSMPLRRMNIQIWLYSSN